MNGQAVLPAAEAPALVESPGIGPWLCLGILALVVVGGGFFLVHEGLRAGHAGYLKFIGKMKCPTCTGKGNLSGAARGSCPECSGRRRVWSVEALAGQRRVVCAECDGTGVVIAGPDRRRMTMRCARCLGPGTVPPRFNPPGRVLALSMFGPKRPLHGLSKIFDLARTVRGLAGTVILLGIALYYGGLDNALNPSAMAGATGLNIAALILAMVPACLVVLLLFTPAAERSTALRRLREPLKAIGLFVAAGAGMIGTLLAVSWLTARAPDPRELGVGTIVVVLLFGLGGLLLLGALIYALFFLICCFYANKYLLRASDGHPLLPAVLTIFAAWSVAGFNLVFGNTLRGIPAEFGPMFLVGGAITLTVIGLIELIAYRPWWSAPGGV